MIKGIKKLASVLLSKRLKRKTLASKKELIGTTDYEYSISQRRTEVFLGLAITRPGAFFSSTDWRYFSFGSLSECLESSKALCTAIISVAEADDACASVHGGAVCPSFEKSEFRINRGKQTVGLHFQRYDRGGEKFPLQFFELLLMEMEQAVLEFWASQTKQELKFEHSDR